MAQEAGRSTAVLLLIFLCCCLRERHNAFVPPSVKLSVERASPWSQASPSVPLPSETSAGQYALLGATLGLVALAHRRNNVHKVAMYNRRGRGGFESKEEKPSYRDQQWFGVGKGYPPMRDRVMVTKKLWEKGFLKRADRSMAAAEKVYANSFYGKHQFQMESRHFLEYIPPCEGATKDLPVATSKGARARKQEERYKKSPAYARKFMEPAKFKKLAIPAWEMPESYTKAVTLQELVAAGVQYGHQKDKWDQRMLPYIYADHDGSHIFDLVQTAAGLNRACYYCQEAAALGAEFILVSTKVQSAGIKEKMQDVEGIHHAVGNAYWRGTCSNFKHFREQVDQMEALEVAEEQGEWKYKSKSEIEDLKFKITNLRKRFDGTRNMKRLPDICIVVDEVKEWQAVREMVSLGIPCVGLIDSNNDPTYIDLPIPGNTTGSRSIELVMGKLIESIRRGKMIGANVAEADKQVINKQWDPWLFTKDRLKKWNRRNLRQAWQRKQYGSYEKYKECNPFGKIQKLPAFGPYNEFAVRDAYGK